MCTIFTTCLLLFLLQLTSEVTTSTCNMSDSDSDASLIIDPDITMERVNPTSVKDYFWVYATGPQHLCNEEAYGKWLVFRSFDDIDEMWSIVREGVETGKLGSLAAKCSTLKYGPSDCGPGPVVNAVICVFTTKKRMNEVGFKLIKIVKHDIRYKTDEATLSGVYVHTGAKRTTIKSIFWNEGEPSLDWKGMACPGPTKPGCVRDECDRWQLNRAKAPEAVALSARVHGKWIIAVQYDELTDLWHFLKEGVESGKLGAIEMVCPSKRDIHDPTELPRMYVYTSEEKKNDVGLRLINIIKADLVYEIETNMKQPEMDWRSPRTKEYRSHVVGGERLRWNNGEPTFEDVKRRADKTVEVPQLDPVKTLDATVSSDKVHGKWNIPVNDDELLHLWDSLRVRMESGYLKAVEMVCSPKRHRNEIHILTSKERKDDVGFKLIHIIRADLVYEPEAPDPWMDWRRQEGSRSRFSSATTNTLFWNHGEPAYEVVTRRGITGNWRTGEK